MRKQRGSLVVKALWNLQKTSEKHNKSPTSAHAILVNTILERLLGELVNIREHTNDYFIHAKEFLKKRFIFVK